MSRSASPLRSPSVEPCADYLPTPPQILFNALLPLRNNPAILVPTIHEPFLRRYQVLPGRAHPEMQGMASGGFILSCIRVLENAEANAASFGRQKKRKNGATGERSAENKRKKEEEGALEGTAEVKAVVEEETKVDEPMSTATAEA